MPMSVLLKLDIFDKVISMKYDIGNDELDKFIDLHHEIDKFYEYIMEIGA